ncbi:hypothetical protein [Pontibacillus halophilus]|uniref:hypothetical protein n=1 Tax=Pontibacillus halophilus TaxID=516704 RepID=UPI00042A6349|nr:hypothetical protein [Pontibacillus halophilus]
MEQQARYEKCLNELTEELNNSDEFKLIINNNFEYYREKFFQIVRPGADRKEITEAFFSYYQELFLEGYFLVDEYLSLDNIEAMDGFLQQPEGIIKEQLHHILNDGEPLDELASGEMLESFEGMIMEQYEAAGSILHIVRLDCMMLGALHRFKKERDSRSLSETPMKESSISGLLHRTDDFFFVLPDYYFSSLYSEGNSEVWSLHEWATHEPRKDYLGTLNVQRFTKEAVQSMFESYPRYHQQGLTAEEDQFLLTLTLEENIFGDWALSNLCDRLVNSIKNRFTIKDSDNVLVRIAPLQEGSLIYTPPK